MLFGIVGIFDRSDIYEIAIREELKKFGASKEDFALVTPELIWNNFSKRRLPSDVAFTIMMGNLICKINQGQRALVTDGNR